jgi:predicted RND superfamily exporter protein
MIEGPGLTGGQGEKDAKGGGIRRWLDRVDRSVDDEVNRFFSPEEKSRTGEAVDKYVDRVEASLQKAGTAAKRTKTGLDELGEDYTARIFGGGKRRKKSDKANIGWITKRPKSVLGVILVVVLLMSYGVFFVVGNENLGIESQMRGDFEIFLPPNDETTTILNEVREDWSTDAMFIYGEITGQDTNVTDVAILKALSAIEGDDDHPPSYYPQKEEGYQEEANWSAHGINPWREDDGMNDGITGILSIPTLLKIINQTATDIANRTGIDVPPADYSVPDDQALIDNIVEELPSDLTQSMVADIDDDGIFDRFAIIVLLDKDPKIQEKVMENTRKILERFNNGEGEVLGAKLYLTGPTPLIETIQKRTIEEFNRVIGLVIVALMIALWRFHGTWKVIPIALVPVALGLMMALGVVGFLHPVMAITPQVVIIAPVLLALGVSYGLYISNRYAEETEGPVNEKLARAVKAINPAIMLSALTTGIGFASLMIGTLPPIFTMGFALTIGIMFTYILTYILVPAFIVILKYEKKRPAKGMKAFSTVPSRNRKKILLVAIIAVIVSVSLIPQVRLDADYLAMAPQDDEIVIKMDEYSRHMGGGQLGMFISRTDPQQYPSLDAMEDTSNLVNEMDNTQAIGVVDVMKSIQLPEEIEIGGFPVTLPPGAQVSLWDVIETLAQGGPLAQQASDQLIDIFYDVLSYEVRELLISQESQRALVYVFMPFMDIDDTRAAVYGVNDIVATQNDAYSAILGHPEPYSKLTGVAAITLAVNDLIIVSQFNSLTVCIMLTFLVLTFIFRSIKVGLITIIPVLCVIALEPGTLVGLDIPLSTITVMIGSIAIGTGVDFSIQISQRVRLGGYKLTSVFDAVEKAGTSFVEATTTMLFGFGMCLFIQIDSIQEFVIMIMILLAYNAIFALVLLPSIFTIWIRRKEARETRLKSRPPGAKGSPWRNRYERGIKAMFRIRDEPDLTPKQMSLPLEMKKEED